MSAPAMICSACWLIVLCAAPAATGHAAERAAAAYPAKPVRIVVPSAPGGPTDVVARAVGQGLAETLGQLVIDDRSGAAGMVGAELVARATPDGYTLLISHSGPFGFGPLLQATPSYDPLKDFTHVSLLAAMP